jgi:hypothetical protein
MTSKSVMINRKNNTEMVNFGVDNKAEAAYNKGRKIRRTGGGLDACFSINSVLFSWQKAGWHDADIEAGNSILPAGVSR